MSSAELDNLVRAGKLKREPAGTKELSYDSRFDLAYGASHALALYALRRMGYRSDNRYLVFQTLAHTAKVPAATWRVLAKAHERRNAIEYEGYLERDEQLLTDLLQAARTVREIVAKLAVEKKGS